MISLEEFLVGGIFAFLLLFARIGSAIMVMPGIGDLFVPTQIRLLFALAFSLVMLPLYGPVMPAVPETMGGLVGVVIIEIIIGVFIGGLARALVAALDVAGTVIAFQSGLSNAFVFNPGLAAQSPVTASFLTLAGLVLLFATDMHHMLLAAVMQSYTAFPVATLPPPADLAEIVRRVVADGFTIGVQMAAPLIIVGLVLYIGTGLINRLMPQIQVFFIILPLQVGLGFAVFLVSASAMLLFWLGRFRDTYGQIFGI